MSTHEVIVAEVSLVFVGDNEFLSTFLNPLRRKIQQVRADGAYDTRACHHVLKNKGITLVFHLEATRELGGRASYK
ncbi:Mobile element protein [Candidatus Enterovibrio escicola]|uniref:Mobile element protein n=1 Tax=Candidatus Enterovibrio escicola TaxID=1927127 RepID=A0A2A5T5R5_9GAMM|nr:Mobile element protein [Candidatus Enterovibrio escacola]